MRAMLSHLTKQTDRDMLYVLMRTNRPRALLSPADTAAGEHLASCGAAVIDTSNATIMPSTPIIQQVILYCISMLKVVH